MVKVPAYLIALIAALGALPQGTPKTTQTKVGFCLSKRVMTEAPAPLETWLERLVQIESGGRSHLTVLDQNGHLSRGCLQFQDVTLVAQMRKYGFFPDIEDSELPTLAYDCEKSKNLARTMLRNNPDNWKHWLNSVRKIGLPPGAE